METSDRCEDCVWWDGDATGMQGYCNEPDGGMMTITGRYEECIRFLARMVGEIF